MAVPILATKVFIPPPPERTVLRSRLMERLNKGLLRKLTLVSAPAGFGKTTLISEWAANNDKIRTRVAWLSLEEADSDPTRFLTYLIAALRTVEPSIGERLSSVLQSPQRPPTESILIALLNEIAAIPDHLVLVLDDYHVIDTREIDNALLFLLEHLPAQAHLIIATRADPPLPLARLRVRSQLTEVRAADLRFTPEEAAGFLHVMGLELSPEDISALDVRTEGWIAGLQLAAISLQGRQAPAGFIRSFAGSHHFVVDYLVEEVLQKQPESVQTFLLRTSILDRLCGPLCDAVLLQDTGSGQATLEYLERANLFVVPLDDERCWYRYHHLFADLLRQRLHQQWHQSTTSSTTKGGSIQGDGRGEGVAELNRRASQWYEDNGLALQAFQYAAAANDVELAERLLERGEVPLYFSGAAAPVLKWLESLPREALDTRPSLWVAYGSALLLVGQNTVVEEKLQAAEAALQLQVPVPGPADAERDDKTRDLIGRIASMRATLAVIQHDAETIIDQSRLALHYLHPNNLSLRIAANWALGYAHQLQGDRIAASRAYAEVLSVSRSLEEGNSIYTIAATLGVGQVQEADDKLPAAAKSYTRVLELAGDPPQPIACQAHLGLARIYYQWNDLEAAQQHGEQSEQLIRQIESIDTAASHKVLLARLKLAQGDVRGAVALLDHAEEFVREHNFLFRMPDVIAAKILTSLRQGDVEAAAYLAEAHNLPLSKSRVHLARGDADKALAVLKPLRNEAEAKGWTDELLKVTVLQVRALYAQSEKDRAVQLLDEALALAEPGGSIRIFVDEGPPMARLLDEALSLGIGSHHIAYIHRLLQAFPVEESAQMAPSRVRGAQAALVEPLSERELEVLGLIAEGLSNQDIAARLYLSLHTVKVHARNIFSKLGVESRTQAVAKGKALGILHPSL